eukprot:TRINITY_DN22729_c0_g1_i1.p1 TRINITY_DN22729_c0_g1~~TRINITY_DN22729_c0_g1_i1.p1  ORF type:complete len:1031 (+),score=146.22 TRINITY_DN22729_c0_g1_i1:201-3095(+)
MPSAARTDAVVRTTLAAFFPLCVGSRVVDRLSSRWTEAPSRVPSDGVPDGPLLGNGRWGAALTWTGPASAAHVQSSLSVGQQSCMGGASDGGAGVCRSDGRGVRDVREDPVDPDEPPPPPPDHGGDAEVAFHFGHNEFFAAPTSGISSCGYANAGGGRKSLGGLALRLHGVTTDTAAIAEQWPGNASVEVAFPTQSGSVLTVRAYMHAVEDVLVVEVHGAPSPGTVSVMLWTYSGCSGRHKTIKGTAAHVKAGKPAAVSTTFMTDRLYTEGSASIHDLSVARANGWPFQAERFNVEWFTLVASPASNQLAFDEAVVLPACRSGAAGLCVRGTLRTPKRTSDPVTIAVRLRRRGLLDDAGDAAKVAASSPANTLSMSQLWDQHLATWNRFWDASEVELPTSPVSEFYWYMSQYLLKASSGGSASPGLFGPFVTSDDVRWMGDVTLNYNAEATYYGAASSNHLEVFEPYFATILQFLPSARRLAAVHAPDCEEALYFPGHILPWDVTSNGKGDLGQKQMGLFASVPFILYWHANRDVAFAKRAWPFFKGVARFWECSLSMGPDGAMHDPMDCAEELCLPDGQIQPDPAVVMSLLPIFFKTVAELASSVNLETKLHDQWRFLARAIAPMPTLLRDGNEVIVDFLDGEGTPLAWSGLFAAFPLGTVGLTSPLPKLSIALRSMDRFFNIWPGGKQGNSFVHAFPAAARIGWQPAKLFALWEAYLKNTTDPDCRMFHNGMVLGCGGTGLENVGGTAYINEMVLQSHEGALRIFPSLPPGVPARFRRLRATGGFLVSATKLPSGEVTDVVVEAPVDTRTSERVMVQKVCTVITPWARTTSLLVNDINFPVGAAGEVSFPVVPSTAYALKPGSGSVATSVMPAPKEVPLSLDSKFVEHAKNVECRHDVAGAPATMFTLGGGGHAIEDCQRACHAAHDCRFLTFFHHTGYCHMYALCDAAGPVGHGGTTYRRL